MERSEEFGREFSPVTVAADLLHLINECDQRCLYEASRWASEQLVYMEESVNNSLDFDVVRPAVESSGHKRISMDFARKLIQNCEYYRARQFLQKTKRETPVENFLYFFSWYMICQRKRAEKEIEDLEKKENQNDEQFFELCKEIERLYRKNPETFDAYLLYLLAQIKQDGQQTKEAKKLVLSALEMDVRCWPAWDLLSRICTEADFTDLEQKPAYRTWQYMVFAAEAAGRLQLLTMAKDFFTEISETIFTSHPYVLCSIATIKINLQENQSALEFFGRVRKLDPYRIDQMNLYSNALFIRDEELKLTELADFFDNSHRFTWENCIILANYYSIRKMHEKAIEFLRRAIRLRPEDSQTFILLGQELLQTKDHQAATLAYRQAIGKY
uniref:ANAPC8 domain-containing protein n=1 Tax=Bursaphelenchus xylophilus TaxID=6326 RepID=A0A1I7S9P1_BURXY